MYSCSTYGTSHALYPVMSSVTAPKGSALPATLALAINVKQDYPSFGYELQRNATTLWEKFEGTPGTHNHIMFGTQSAWYFCNLAGIHAEAAREPSEARSKAALGPSYV